MRKWPAVVLGLLPATIADPAAAPALLASQRQKSEKAMITPAARVHELVGRDSYPVSLCGWIGGSSLKPAWCSSHSSCAWNTDNSFVGCCDTKAESCTFYTACVDSNTSPSVDRTDVYTCRGTSVCYKNTYFNGFTQYGCGQSDWATTILSSFDGMNTAMFLQIALTGNKISPISFKTSPISTITSSILSTAIVSVSRIVPVTPTPTSTVQSSPSPSSVMDGTESAAQKTSIYPPAESPSSVPVGTIAGASVGGVAGLVAIGAAIYFCLRARKRHQPDEIGQLEQKQNPTHQPQSPVQENSPTAELESPNPSPAPFSTLSMGSAPHCWSPSSTTQTEPSELP